MRNTLENTIANGASSSAGTNMIVCADGARISVIAGAGAYSIPRRLDYRLLNDGDLADWPGPYTHVEAWPLDAGLTVPASWHKYADGQESTCLALMSAAEDCTCSGPFGYVPVELVREWIDSHGGDR